jgi:hypothetical protein
MLAQWPTIRLRRCQTNPTVWNIEANRGRHFSAFRWKTAVHIDSRWQGLEKKSANDCTSRGLAAPSELFWLPFGFVSINAALLARDSKIGVTIYHLFCAQESPWKTLRWCCLIKNRTMN